MLKAGEQHRVTGVVVRKGWRAAIGLSQTVHLMPAGYAGPDAQNCGARDGR